MKNVNLIRHQSELPVQLVQPDTYRADYRREAPAAGLLASWNLVLSRKKLVLAVALASLGASVAITKLQTPIYRARTVIKVESRNEYFLNLREIDSTLNSDTGESYLNTQSQILQSESIIRKAMARLDRPVPGPPRLARTVLSLFRPAVADSPAGVEETLRWLAQNLSANPVHLGQTIELSFESPDGLFAAAFLNALSASFEAETSDQRHEAGRLTRARLSDQLDEVRQKLEVSETALQNYAQTAGLIFTSENRSSAEDQLRALEQELATARADRILKESQRDIAASSPAASLPPVLDNMTLRDYQSRLMELHRQRAELHSVFTENHPEIKAVEAQVRELESGLAVRRSEVVERIYNDYQAALNRETLLSGVVSEQTKRVAGDSANSVRYKVLQREVETNRTLYDAMLQRASNSWLASAMEITNIRVIDPATVPPQPFKPRLGQNAMFGGVGGILFGIVLVLFAEGRDRRIRSPFDLRSQLNVPLLGVVPFAALKPGGRETVSALPASGDKVMTAYRTNEGLADSFRATLTSILSWDRRGVTPKTLVVTSAATGDGKSTVACNLGLALAEVKRRVLLIDADTRNPSLHRMFGIRNTAGLTDILRGDTELTEALLTCVDRTDPSGSGHAPSGTECRALAGLAGAPGLYVLTRGTAHGNAVSLLHSLRMEKLLDKLREDFDAIVIDTPPLIPLPNARLLGIRSDGVVLVIRSGDTTAVLAEEALTLLEGDGITTLGTVLNAFDSRNSPYNYPSDPGSQERFFG